MRILGLAAFAAAFALAGPAVATALPFNPEEATRAWLDTMGPEATARSNSYFEGGYILDFAGTALSIVVAGLMLILGWGRGVRTWLEKTVKWFPLVAFGSAFFYIFVSSVLTFPFSYYMGFVRQHEYNLSTQDFAAWFNEQMIGFGLGLVIGSLFLTVLYLIIRAARKTWWIWGSAVTIAFAAVMSMAFPVFIAPLFNESEPMAQSELRDSIIAMAQANGVPADNVYVYDRSRQTNSISANVSGFGPTTRISLADTLLDRASPEAVRAVMAHEIGHYVLGHNVSGLIMNSILIVFSFAFVHFAFGWAAKNERWGIRDISDPGGLPRWPIKVAIPIGCSASIARWSPARSRNGSSTITRRAGIACTMRWSGRRMKSPLAACRTRRAARLRVGSPTSFANVLQAGSRPRLLRLRRRRRRRLWNSHPPHRQIKPPAFRQEARRAGHDAVNAMIRASRRPREHTHVTGGEAHAACRV